MFSKRVAVSVWFVLCGVLGAGSSSGQTFNGSVVNTAGNSLVPSVGTGGCTVAPQTTGGTIFNNTVAGLAGGALVGSVQINMTHSFASDLDIFLRAPNGQILELSSDNGAGNDNYTNTRFQDGAPSITTGAAPFSGTFSPEGTADASCAAFAGNIASLGAFTAGQNGVWQLVIEDDIGADSGAMLSWSITFGCVLSCPADQALATDPGQCAVAVNYAAPIASNCTMTLEQTSGLPSGSSFPPGTTTNCFGIMAGPSCCFEVTVSDAEAPVLTCPADIVVDGSQRVEIDLVVTDNCGNMPASCVPASGAVFPVGETPVHCEISDPSGNRDSCDLLVTVRPIMGVPMASSLGLAALALLLAGGAVVVLRRQA